MPWNGPAPTCNRVAPPTPFVGTSMSTSVGLGVGQLSAEQLLVLALQQMSARESLLTHVIAKTTSRLTGNGHMRFMGKPPLAVTERVLAR
jgi:hypothetical protein